MENNSKIELKIPTIDPSQAAGVNLLMEIFDIGPFVAFSVVLGFALTLGLAVYYVIHSAPPSHITIASGPEGSTYHKNALKYAKVLEDNGVKVTVTTSEGSIDNIAKLRQKVPAADLVFAQAGIVTENTADLISLGSVSYQPLMLFYRKGIKAELIADFKGKKIAVGPKGSGTQMFALKILELNGIKEDQGTTKLEEWEGKEAAQALLDGKIDAAFVMSESSSSEILHELLRDSKVQMFNFKQAHGYSRKVDYLSVLELPQGAIEFGQNIPDHDILLLSPMVELVARKDFHPALIDLVLEAAVQVHSKPGIYQHRGEFPNTAEHAIHVSLDAVRYHQSGKGWLYNYLPYWLASLLARIMVVFLPIVFVIIPMLKSIPAFFRWKMQLSIRRRYRELLRLEKKFLQTRESGDQSRLRDEFESIERTINKMKVKAAYADQFYGLRGHIDYVRGLFDHESAGTDRATGA